MEKPTVVELPTLRACADNMTHFALAPGTASKARRVFLSQSAHYFGLDGVEVEAFLLSPKGNEPDSTSRPLDTRRVM
jgi:hypothetical protein